MPNIISIQRYEAAITTPAILRIECASCGAERKRWGKSITTTGWWRASTENGKTLRFCYECGLRVSQGAGLPLFDYVRVLNDVD